MLPSLRAACLLATVAVAIPLCGGAWLLVAAYNIPRAPEPVGPAGPDWSGVIEGIGGCVAMGWALPMVPLMVGMWLRHRWAMIGFAAVAAAQAAIHGLVVFVLLKPGPDVRWSALHVGYIAMVLIAAIAAGLAAARQPAAFRPGRGLPLASAETLHHSG